MQQLLPFVDQQTLYNQLPLSSNVQAFQWGTKFGTPIWTIIPLLTCPSDPANPKNVTDKGTGPEDSEGFHGNIVMCAGSTDFGNSDSWHSDGIPAGNNLNGMFYALSSTRFADVADGLSNTVMGSELIINPDGAINYRDNRGRYYNAFRGVVLFSTQFPPNTSVPDEVDTCDIPNPLSPCNTNSDVIVIYARSYHPGGANVVMGDGSTRFISENISTEIFRALGTRAGSEKSGEF